MRGLLGHVLLSTRLNKLDTNKNSVLHYAVRNTHKDLVDRLLELEDIEVDITGWEGMTPLHYSSRLMNDIGVIIKLF